MAKLTRMPNWQLAGRMKPPLDFYTWKGIWCARYYPLRIHQPGTPAQQATWDAMNTCVDGWNDLAKIDREAYTRFVRDSHRTGKDFYYRIHLKGETTGGAPWCQAKLSIFGLWMIGHRIVITTSVNCRFELKYALDREQEKAWGWLKQGYCIRGRKWVRKRKLWERWQRSKTQQEAGYTTTHTFIIMPVPTWSRITFTVQSMTNPFGALRGRTGTYGFDSGEVYP